VASVVQQETLPAHIMWTPPTASTSATAAAAAVLSANLSDACNMDYANNNASFAYVIENQFSSNRISTQSCICIELAGVDEDEWMR
jgi:hypothetical protein